MKQIEQKVKESAKKRILFLPHAIKQMSRPDRMISIDDVRQTILYGEIIEYYPDDHRGESCLLFHKSSSRPIHVVCAPKTDYLAVITSYIPDYRQWSTNWKSRR